MHCFAATLRRRLFVFHRGLAAIVGTVRILPPVGPPTGGYVLAITEVHLAFLDFVESMIQIGDVGRPRERTRASGRLS